MQSVGIIGGADGPTAILVAGEFPWLLLAVGGAVLLAAILIALYLKHR